MKSVLLCKVFILVFFIKSLSTFAQISKQWEARYTEAGYLDEGAQDIITDANGNSYVLGNSGYDALVAKYSLDGNLVWSLQAGRGVFREYPNKPARDFKIDTDGNLYILLRGYQGSDNFDYGLSLLKLNSSGQIVWQTYMAGAYNDGEISLAVHTDGSSFILYRYSYTDVKLTKISNTGVVSWSKVFASVVESFTQQVRILNNSVVAWHYSGYQTYSRKSYLHVYNLNGDLVWENSYQYNTDGTHIRGVQFHANELIVGYYITNSNKAFHQITRYSIADGSTIKSFNVQMDNTFQNDEPISVLYVGDDSHVYLMGTGSYYYKVQKFTLPGAPVWSYEYYPGLAQHQALDFVVNKSTSSASVLLKNLNTNSTTVVNFKPDMTNTLLANLTTTKSGLLPVALAESELHILIAATFDNGMYKKDLLVAKFTKTNTRVWETSFLPRNSAQHEPSCTATDAQGNIYVGGMLSLDLEKRAFGLIKYSPAGEQLWTKKFAPDNKYGNGLFRTKVMAMAATPEGNIVVTGGIQLGNQFRTSSEPPVELYTVKLNTQGDIIWTAKTTSTTDDYITGLQIDIDDNQNIYTLGSNYNVSDFKRNQMVLVKYDINGIQQWEKRFSMYSDYTDTGTTGPDTNIPKMKVVNNIIYVASDGSGTLDNVNYFRAAELRKFNVNGDVILLKQFTCDGCQSTQVRDLQIDASGNMILLHADEFSKTTLSKVSPTGQVVWSKFWTNSVGLFPINGSVAFDAANNLYVVRASSTELNYTKINANGVELWNKKENLSGLDPTYGHPSYVFVTNDNAPVFLSTNKNAQGSKYFFVAERDKNTGEVKHSETFDEIFDTFGPLRGDQLVSVIKPANSMDLFVSGVIQDKSKDAETIVTLKYSITPAVSAPQPFTATAISSSKIKLTFAAAPANIERIVFSSVDGIQFEQIAKTKALEVFHSALDADHLYYYRIVDTDGVNHSVYSAVVEARTLKRPVIVGSDLIETEQEQSFSIPLSSLQVENAPEYPIGYSLIISTGAHYSFSNDLITAHPDFLGTMSVTVQIAYAEDTSAIYNVTVNVYEITGVKELQRWSVTPNPVRDVLSISYDSNEEQARITIFDNLGRSVYSAAFTDGLPSLPYDIDFKSYAVGLYIVLIEDKEMRKRRFRVIKF